MVTRENVTRKITWLVFANTVKAEIYKIFDKTCSLLEILEHPESRLKSKDLMSDKPGHYKSASAARGVFIPPVDAHEETHKKFAKEIDRFLENGREKHQYSTLILCAEPHFYGLLNQMLGENVRGHITKIVQKDYIPLPNPKKMEAIKEILQIKTKEI